ncbi:hypothetical protein OE88DRAFT_1465193 [Heliocybe sulcata]|uniref:Uncharacterized protein n=1 Tax=Heliocybe sulcata TaxID=5364 RepID=A0A5C3N6Q2_9AGAM|nr:hypothetical protein OE88DRAFT_1465193 [Heliocybe sulcata]
MYKSERIAGAGSLRPPLASIKQVSSIMNSNCVKTASVLYALRAIPPPGPPSWSGSSSRPPVYWQLLRQPPTGAASRLGLWSTAKTSLCSPSDAERSLTEKATDEGGILGLADVRKLRLSAPSRCCHCLLRVPPQKASWLRLPRSPLFFPWTLRRKGEWTEASRNETHPSTRTTMTTCDSSSRSRSRRVNRWRLVLVPWARTVRKVFQMALSL